MAIEVAGNGSPVLAFHGTPGSRLDARFWAAAAADAALDARFVGFDRPGYGRAPAQPGRTLRSVAEHAGEVVDGRVRLLAVSGGGPFALAAAALLGDRVEAVAIASGLGPPECGLGALSAMRTMSEAETRSWAEGLIASQPLPAPTGVEVLDLFMASQAEGTLTVDGIVEDLLTLREPWTTDLRAITAPVRMFHAVDDDRCPIEGARFLARAIRAAELVEWDEGGHMATAFHLPEVLSSLLA
jgi:pimeloyl-ACP methyl ester carboxylesterase